MSTQSRLRLTRIALYYYTEKYTLSFSWRCRWHWWPERRETGDDGWFVRWGWFIVEKDAWPQDDPWGGKTVQLRLDILSNAMSDES